jgi:hypothetical protein
LRTRAMTAACHAWSACVKFCFLRVFDWVVEEERRRSEGRRGERATEGGRGRQLPRGHPQRCSRQQTMNRKANTISHPPAGERPAPPNAPGARRPCRRAPAPPAPPRWRRRGRLCRSGASCARARGLFLS